MTIGMGGHTNGERTDAAGERHELAGVGQLPDNRIRMSGRIATECHEVDDA